MRQSQCEARRNCPWLGLWPYRVTGRAFAFLMVQDLEWGAKGWLFKRIKIMGVGADSISYFSMFVRILRVVLSVFGVFGFAVEF